MVELLSLLTAVSSQDRLQEGDVRALVDSLVVIRVEQRGTQYAPGAIVHVDGDVGYIAALPRAYFPVVNKEDKRKVAKSAVLLRAGSDRHEAIEAELLTDVSEYDIAILTVRRKGLPKPLRLTEGGALKDGAALYLAGYHSAKDPMWFPEGPPQWVSGTVNTPIQLDGRLRQIKLREPPVKELHGIVLDAQGRLIGLGGPSRAAKETLDLVPSASILSMLHGKFRSLNFQLVGNVDGKINLRAELALWFGTLGLSKDFKILMLPKEKVPARPPRDPDDPGTTIGPDASEHLVTMNAWSGSTEIKIQGETDKDQAFIFQATFLRADGTRWYSDPIEWTAPFSKGGRPASAAKETGTSLAGDEGSFDGFKVRPLKLSAKDTGFSPAPWSSDGKYFYPVIPAGTVRMIRAADLVEERQLVIEGGCHPLQQSKEGLVTYAWKNKEFWVLHPATLELVRRVGADAVIDFTTSPGSSFAFVSRGNLDLRVFCLRGEKELKTYTVADFQKGAAKVHKTGLRLPTIKEVAATGDGKYLLVGGFGCAHRLRINGNELTYEETGPRLGSGDTMQLYLSPEGQYVALMLTGGAAPPDHPKMKSSGSYVYRVTDLQKPAFVSKSGAVRAFDPKTKKLYGWDLENSKLSLMNISGTGEKSSSLGKSPLTIYSLSPSPEGGRLLLLSQDALSLVDIPN